MALEPLTTIERELLAACLSGEDSVLAQLRSQSAKVMVSERTLTGDGFITTLELPRQARPAEALIAIPSLRIEDVCGELFGHGSPGFCHLYIAKGLLGCLEFFCAGGGWPEPAIWRRLAYLAPLSGPGPESPVILARRDLAALRRQWASA